MYQLVSSDGTTPLVAERQTDDPRWPGQHRIPHVVGTLAGVPITPDLAVQIAAVWACIRYISQTIALRPWRVYRAGDKGAEVITTNPIDYLIWKRPSPEWSSFQFRETLTHWALRWGNGYAEIERDVLGRPAALWPIHPERVHVCRDPDTGKLFYHVHNGAAPAADIEPEDVFHIRGFGEGPVGVNVIDYAAPSLGWAKAMQQHAAAFFGNGANVSGFITTKEKLDSDPVKRMRSEIERMYVGPRRANKIAFLDNGADFKAAGIDPEKAQLIEANYFLVEEVCRWFGVPPHKVAHLLRATFSNIEQQNIEVVNDSLMPWTKRFEDEADYKLFGQNRTNLHTRIDLSDLLKGDFKSEQEGLQLMRNAGVISADEWRGRFNMNPMLPGEGGDKYVMQSQYTELANIGEAVSAPPPASSPSTPATGDQSTTGEDDAAELEAQRWFQTVAEAAEVAHA
jgi:HK97 family phage portal protein